MALRGNSSVWAVDEFIALYGNRSASIANPQIEALRCIVIRYLFELQTRRQEKDNMETSCIFLACGHPLILESTNHFRHRLESTLNASKSETVRFLGSNFCVERERNAFIPRGIRPIGCKLLILIDSSGRTRTYNPSVNSRMFCH